MQIDVNSVIVYILAIAGAIVTLGGATAVLKRWWSNSKGMKNQEKIEQNEKNIGKLDKRVEDVENKTITLENHQKNTDEFARIMCNSMLALLNHAITGSSTEALEKAEEEIKQYLINK